MPPFDSKRKGPAGGLAGHWLVDWIPVVAGALVVAHVLALVYWIYKLANERPPERRKVH